MAEDEEKREVTCDVESFQASETRSDTLPGFCRGKNIDPKVKSTSLKKSNEPEVFEEYTTI